MEKTNSNSEKIWLVRSSTRILGPYDLESVMHQLSSKQISIIDEIRQPDGRWMYIRENHIFLELIRHLRNEQDDAVENTVTTTQSSHTFTKSGDIMPIDDLTPTPITRTTDHSHSQMKDITKAKEVTSQRGDARVFGMMQEDRMQRMIQQRAARWRWGLIAASAVVLVVAGAMFLRQGHRKENDFDSLGKEALRYKSVGLYEKALTSYKRLGAIKDPDVELQFQMAPLLISEDRQSLLGRRILEKSLLATRSRAESMEAHIGIALTYLQEGDLKEAESYLQKALTFEPSNLDAQTDLAIIQIKKGNLGEAAQNIDILNKRAPSAFLTALKAMVEIEKSRETPNPTALKEVFDSVQDQLRKANYLRQELSFLGLNLAMIMGDKRLQESSLLKFLEQAPFQSSRYRKNPMVDWRILQWDYIEKFCAEAFKAGNLSSLEKGARAVCLMEVNRDQDAFRILSEARGENPKDPHLMALEAAYLMKTDRQREAGALLKMIPNSSDFLTMHLNATLCQQQGTLDCAENFFQQMATTVPADVESYYGLAWVSFERSQRAKAYDKIRVGLQMEPNYLPLLDLRNRMEEE